MSDAKRATLITVGAPKSAKNNVTKTVRLTINLDESNESKYPELNYKELVIAAERKKRVQNGKTTGLDPFSDNDDDVERVARKFEQKYGGKSTYGRKGRSKQDEYADIGAGYDENDSFIDNTHGYDEMIPPECDTFYGGFYINSGSLEFKTVPENQQPVSDGEPTGNRRNKRRITSSSSEDDSSESSSESESQDEKDSKVIANGAVDSHKTEHRKKKNKNIDKKKKPKKIRRTDSSAATSGKQTSDDNVHGEAESADSRTSQSDSLTSKPAPSSENAITSDSSRDVDAKVELKLPSAVVQLLEEMETSDCRQLAENTIPQEIDAKIEQYVVRLERTLSKCSVDSRSRRVVWSKIARALNVSRTKLMQKVKALTDSTADVTNYTLPTSSVAQSSTTNTTTTTSHSNKRKLDEDLTDIDVNKLSSEEREANIVVTLQRLKALIDERKPGMMANYNAECERVQEERKKIMIASASDGAPHIEKRLPKRRFPWCPRTRALLAHLRRLAGDHKTAAILLAKRALPLFPNGFVRMPTLLRQADLSKEIKPSDVKRQRLGSSSQPAMTQPLQPNQLAQPVQPNQPAQPVQPNQPAQPLQPNQPAQPFTEPIQFPSSLTVTTTLKPLTDKTDTVTEDKEKQKSNSVFGNILNSFSISKDLVVEKPEEKKKDTVKIEKNKEEIYIPRSNIGSSITITPVTTTQPKNDRKGENSVIVTADNTKIDKKAVNSVTIVAEKQKEPLIRVKSPAALNEMYKKDKEKHHKKPEKNHSNLKEKRVDSPLHIDTNYQLNKKEPVSSPKNKIEEISKKQIENMRVVENNIPRPALVPVHHSPTFAKPDKRPPEVKKKKDVLILSDVDPLAEEPVSVDDSSSDVELIEENAKSVDKSEPIRSDTVPCKDKVSARNDTNKKTSVDSVKHSSKVVPSVKDVKIVDFQRGSEKLEEPTKNDIDIVMRNLREMEHSQETTKFNSNSYAGVITSAKHNKSSSKSSFNARNSMYGDTRSDKDKLTNFFESNGWM